MLISNGNFRPCLGESVDDVSSESFQMQMQMSKLTEVVLLVSKRQTPACSSHVDKEAAAKVEKQHKGMPW